MSQYGFAASDPVNNSDPMGLKVCFSGATQADREDLAKEFMKATGTTFDLKSMDAMGCVNDARRDRSSNIDRQITNDVLAVVRSTNTYTLVIGRLPTAAAGESGTGWATGGSVLYLDPNDVGQPYGTKFDHFYLVTLTQLRAVCSGDGSTFDLGQMIVHEMGYASHYELNRTGSRRSWAMTLENLYNNTNNKTNRPEICH